MKSFSIRTKAKYLVAAVLAAACDPGPNPEPDPDETSTDTSDETGPKMDVAPEPDVPPTCESLCPETTTLECGEGERCVPTPTHPECQPCS